MSKFYTGGLRADGRFDRTIGGTGRGAAAEDETPKKTPVAIARTARPAFKSPLMQRPMTTSIPSSRLRGDPLSSPAPTSSPVAGPSTSRVTAPKPIPAASFYSTPAPKPKPIPAASFYAPPVKKTSPKKKLHVGSATSGKDIEAWGGALHDPNAPGAVVMERPPIREAEQK